MKRLLLCISILIVSIGTFAETITGKVTNRQGEAMPFVTVSVLSKDSALLTGAITDENGRYSVEIKSSQSKVKRRKTQAKRRKRRAKSRKNKAVISFRHRLWAIRRRSADRILC